ncbi:MAG TPA: ATP-dependent Clp protease proteolytic subunit, partial [Casimicrobium sp.]|nr:ATP-dependent Clp protease proteolytic subunit [Casimicrobium sp.]
TMCIGMAASMGAFLLAAGTKGKRFALPNSTVMIHQPSGGFSGQVSDIERHASYIVRLKQRYNKHMADFTGRPLSEVEPASDRDNFMTAEEALSFGMVDRVLSTRAEPLPAA